MPDEFDGQGFLWFELGTSHTELHLIPEAPQAIAGDRHICMDSSELDAITERREVAGHSIERYDLLPGRPQRFVRDPFGNLIALTDLRSPWQSRA